MIDGVDGTITVINRGSASVKITQFDLAVETSRRVWKGVLERIDFDASRFTATDVRWPMVMRFFYGIRIAVLAVGTLSDHVAPWRSLYKIHAKTNADVTFVLSNGGHNAGIVRPQGKNKRYHQIAATTISPLISIRTVCKSRRSTIISPGGLAGRTGLLADRARPLGRWAWGAAKGTYRPLCEAPDAYVCEPSTLASK